MTTAHPPAGQLFIVSAPSGAGKTSLVQALLRALPDLEKSVSYTTRPPRNGEVEGVNYHFVDKAGFARMAQQNAFIEHATVFGHSYGTAWSDVRGRLARGVDVVLEIDWQGARQLRCTLDGSIGIFILPPSRAVLEERLHRRGLDSQAVIARRLEGAVTEISHYDEYDYLVVNDDFDRALADLGAIVSAYRLTQRCQSLRLASLLRELID